MKITSFSDFKTRFKTKQTTALIICPGSSINEYKDKIQQFIDINKPLILGVNNTSLFNLDIHLYTNNQRLTKYGQLIKAPTVMIGKYVKSHNIPKHINKYVLIDYTDRDMNEPMEYKNGMLHGYYRGSANLAIMILYVLGIEKIFVVGMDGYTFKPQIHFYEDSKEEQKSIDEWNHYDEILLTSLKNLKQFINFKIITPTLFKQFYKEGIL